MFHKTIIFLVWKFLKELKVSVTNKNPGNLLGLECGLVHVVKSAQNNVLSVVKCWSELENIVVIVMLKLISIRWQVTTSVTLSILFWQQWWHDP